MTTSRKDAIAPCGGLVCSVLTPPGRGAIATVGVRGPGAAAAVARCFDAASGHPISDLPIGRVVFGRFRSLAGAREELVVGLVGPDEIEVHCHGGTAAVQAVLEALIAAGCRRATWPEWIRTQERDPLAAAALEALPDARTERTAAILLDQYHGALRRALEKCLVVLSSNPRQATQLLEDLLSRSDLGRHLTRPWRVVLTGAPNVGKSSLINALLGYQRAIVFDQPGTTRDVLTATTAFDGWPAELSDTAGLRVGGDAIEAEGVVRALRQVADADLVIEVLECYAIGHQYGTEYSVLSTQYAAPPATAPTTHHSPLTTRSALIVHNKCDLAAPLSDSRPDGLAVSAKTGQGIDELCRAISQRIVPQPPPREGAVPFTDAQIAALLQAQHQLASGDAAGASESLAALLG